MKPRMETLIASDGTPIRYSRQGQGRPVIFLHGWTAGSQEWLPFAAELTDEFEVYCWDARGHGGHPIDLDCDTHIARMVDDLQHLIEHHELKEVVLVGHSMGALTTWEYIRTCGTDALSGICILDQSPKLVTDATWGEGVYGDFDGQRNARFIERLRDDFAEGVLELVAFGHNVRSRENYERNSRGFQQILEYLRTLPGEQLTRCWASLTEQDYRAVLPQIDVPALLIYGDESQFYSLDLARWVAEQIPQSDLHIYENACHSPHMWHKDRFISQLRDFSSTL